MKILFVLALIFAVYAIVTQYRNTDKTKPVPVRVKAALTAAAMSIGGFITAWVMDVAK